LRARLAAERPVWGGLPAAMRFKQALVAAIGPERALAVASEALGLPAAGRLGQRPLRSMAEAAGAAARHHIRLWEGGETFVNPPLRVMGAGTAGRFGGRSRAGYLACFEDCLIRGRSSILLLGGVALHDFEAAEHRAIPENHEYDTAILRGDPDSIHSFEPAPGETVEEIDEAFMLSGNRTVDFGHWVTEYLPKLALASLAGLPPMPLVIDQQTPATIRAALPVLMPVRPLMALPNGQVLRVRRLWVASNPVYMPFYPTQWNSRTWLAMATPPQGFARLIDEVIRLARPDADPIPPAPRLFLARRPEHWKKRLVNHAEIEAIATGHGFAIVYPEAHTLLQQIAMMQRAEVVLGPEGSNMLLPIHARKGSRIGVLNGPDCFPLADLAGVFAARGCDYAVLAGAYADAAPDLDWPFWQDYRIDPTLFATLLEGWDR
jgi:hypothetical protein